MKMREPDSGEKKRLLTGALERMLQCTMPDTLRTSIESLLARADATEYELQSAYANYARRLVLARPRAEIAWNPTVDARQCIGCGVCVAFCPHTVYTLSNGVAAVVRPAMCVILCSNCAALCSAGAISFPPQKEYRELLHYE